MTLPLTVQGRENMAPEILEGTFNHETKIQDLISYAVQRNPAITAARAKWRLTVENYKTVTALPDPQLDATYFPDPIETRLGPQDWNLSLTQTLPYPGKLTSKGRMQTAKADIARLGLEKAARDVSVAVRQSFHEFIYIQQAQRLTKQTMDLLDHLRLTAETAHAQDRATMVDVMKAQSQTAQLRYDLLLLEELEATEKIQLNSLLNRDPAAPLGPARPVVVPNIQYTAQEIFQLAEENLEEIKIAQAMVRKAEAGIDLALAKNLPDFKVGIFYAGIGQPDSTNPPTEAGQDAYGIKAGISIPLWFGKNSGNRGSAQAELRRAKADQQNIINKSRVNIQKTFFRLNNAKRLVALYRDELLPQAANAMEIAETWFLENQGSFTDFIETTATWYNFQLSLARAQADSGKYLARLEQFTGRLLTTPDTQQKESGQ